MKNIVLTPVQKALEVNLNPETYGTFAEVGAGQEVVRHFFRAGGASGTIAKAMSAYDKDFSDAIYGKEANGRYVCESRLKNMINHEYGLITERLNREKHPNKRFFSFANNVETINFSKTNDGHGWMGLRFQLCPNSKPNDVILHYLLHEREAKQQQESAGILGVNLLHGCMFHSDDPKMIIKKLFDNISKGHIEINMIQMNGPDFDYVDNRLLSLHLVRERMTDAVIFSPDGVNLQPSDVLYKKNILAIRGSFRPVTKVNIDMIKNGYNKFILENRVRKEDLQVLFEITLSNLSSEGEIDEQDFLDRADILCSLGQTVLISNYQRYYKLLDYFSRFTKKRMGIIMGVPNLKQIFEEKYYRHLSGGILEAFGRMFNRDLKIYLYPYQKQKEGQITNSKNINIHPRFRSLYEYLIFNQRIIDIEYDPKVLNIFSPVVLRMIKNGISGWEDMVPAYVDNVIKQKKLFGSKLEPKETNDNQKVKNPFI
tara:strand:+ start:4033 stop:5484 length:1452 start_codon:yes stop_codon:yes gene_type:complete